mmetsp:Transcript_26888/g.57617  ORF Transcript_26888/g.57617 Transcript_26888/m.57617 type:complete len:80 (-) Transcript_26888:331-570(-)
MYITVEQETPEVLGVCLVGTRKRRKCRYDHFAYYENKKCQASMHSSKNGYPKQILLQWKRLECCYEVVVLLLVLSVAGT